MTALASAVPSTPMELVSRLTEQLSTPGTALTAFSTRAEQAAQLIPVTLYCFILVLAPSDYFISFCRVFSNSSTTSSFPARTSLTTQERI